MMWKLVMSKQGTKHEHYALNVPYLQELLTLSRRQGWDGFIFRVDGEGK